MKSKKLIDEFKRHIFLENGSAKKTTNLAKNIFMSRYGLDGRLNCSSKLTGQELNLSQIVVRHNCRGVMSSIIPSIAAEKYYAQFRSECLGLLEKILPFIPGSSEEVSKAIGISQEEILFVCRISKLIGLSPSIHVGFAGILTVSQRFAPAHKWFSTKANLLSVKGFFTLTEYVDVMKVKFPKLSRSIFKAILDAKFKQIHAELMPSDGDKPYVEYWYFVPGTKNKIIDPIKKRIFTFGKCSFSIFDELKVRSEFTSGLLAGSELELSGSYIKANSLTTRYQFSPKTTQLIRILKKMGGLKPSSVLLSDFLVECEKNGINKRVAKILVNRESIFYLEDKYCWFKF